MQFTKRTWLILSLLSILPLLCVPSLHAQYQGQPGQYDQNDPPASIARIGSIQGNVSLQAAGTDDWSQAPPNYPMVAGDRIYTGARARAVLQLGGAELRLWQSTDVTLTNIADQYEQIGLAAGSLRLHVFQMEPGSQIEVDTPNGATIIESPGDYRFEAFQQNYQQAASSIVTITSGNAQITGPGINQPVSSGYSIGLFGTNPVELQYLDVPEYDDLDYWSFDLDRRYQNSVSARYVSRQMVGYNDLDAYGTWNPNTEYGPGWFPNSVPNGWQPYSTGHWAYVQPWGYTWVDDAPWGFAPFHYGRWSQVDGRWGWFPGPPTVRPVYSPALVAFVGGGPGDDRERGGGGGFSIGIHFGGGGVGISAWFPIGVGEPYVPWYRCSPRYAERVNTSNVNVAVIRNTTVVNNYNTYINKTVINNTTINKTTVNNTVINNTTVNNFNYANRSQVTAVPASAMASGAPVAKQVVQLSPQQRQQIAATPISISPTAPPPATPHPSLVAASAPVARPAARPTLMTPVGLVKAVPSAAPAKPVVIAKLPAPVVVPKNAPPPPAPPKPIQANRPSAPVPVAAPVRPVANPAAPVVQQPGRPAAPSPAPGRPVPVAPVNPARPIQQTRPETAPVAAPRSPVVPEAAPRQTPPPAQAPISRPAAPPAGPTKPVAPVPEQRPAPGVRPVPPAAVPPSRPNPAPEPPPARVAPARPATPPPVTHPEARPSPAPAPVERPLPQQRPAPPPAQRPIPPAQARPLPKPEPKPDDRPAPKQDKKPEAR